MTKIFRPLLLIALFFGAPCYGQNLYLECKLQRWLFRPPSVFELILITRNLQFGEAFLVEIDPQKKVASASNSAYRVTEATSERYVILGEVDAFSFDRDTGQVIWAIAGDNKNGSLPLASGNCDARANKKKF